MKLEWSRYTDGVPRIELRPIFTLSLQEMAGALAHHESFVSIDWSSLNQKTARELIRDALHTHGAACLGWNYPEQRHYDAVRLAFGPPPDETDTPTPVTT